MKISRILILILILALVLVPLAAKASDFVQTPPPDSFRGMVWKAPLSKFPDLLPVQEPGYKDTYFKKNESTTLGKAKITSVAYYFHKDKLYRVGVAYKGRVNQFFLKDMLMQQFGPGQGRGLRYGWMWPHFSIELDYDNDHDTGSLYYTYEGPLN